MTDFKRKGEGYLDSDKFATRAETMAGMRKAWNPSPKSERVALADAAGRVSAERVESKHTLPVMRESMSDGIAVRFADFEHGVPDTTGWVEGRDYTAADTGDDFDDAFDTVINIERVSFTGGRISIGLEKDLKKGQMVKNRGGTLREGEEVLSAGVRINPFQVGLLASAGADGVAVLSRPKVAYIPTGDELLPAGAVPGRGQHVETNSLMCRAMLTAWQAELVEFPIVRDQKAELEKAMDKALSVADIVLINGGSSMGSEDFVSGMLPARAGFMQHGVLCIPGRPAAVAVVDGKPVVNMPGPPFAAFCVMDWCVKELVAHWYGLPAARRVRVPARITATVNKPEDHDFYVRLHLMKDMGGNLLAEPVTMQSRYADAAASFNAMIVAPAGGKGFEGGQEIMAEILFSDLY